MNNNKYKLQSIMNYLSKQPSKLNMYEKKIDYIRLNNNVNFSPAGSHSNSCLLLNNNNLRKNTSFNGNQSKIKKKFIESRIFRLHLGNVKLRTPSRELKLTNNSHPHSVKYLPIFANSTIKDLELYSDKLKVFEELLKELVSFNSQKLNEEIESIFNKIMKMGEEQCSNAVLLKDFKELNKKFNKIKQENIQLRLLINKKANDLNKILNEFNSFKSFHMTKKAPIHIKKNTTLCNSSISHLKPSDFVKTEISQVEMENELLEYDTVELLTKYGIQDTKEFLYYEPKIRNQFPKKSEILAQIPKLNIIDIKQKKIQIDLSTQSKNSFENFNINSDISEVKNTKLDDAFLEDSNMTLEELDNKGGSFIISFKESKINTDTQQSN